MLHLLSRSPVDNAVFDYVGEQDGIILHGVSVWLAKKGHFQNENLLHLLVKQCKLYVLTEDLNIYGIESDLILPEVTVINYQRFVELTTEHQTIKSWH